MPFCWPAPEQVGPCERCGRTMWIGLVWGFRYDPPVAAPAEIDPDMCADCEQAFFDECEAMYDARDAADAASVAELS